MAVKDRTAWLEERRKGIGGSDAAAVLGMNPNSSPLAVYMDKLGLAPEKEETEAMRLGTDLEEYVAQRFCEETGKQVCTSPHAFVHPDFLFMRANVDRLVDGEDAGLECKTTSALNRTKFDMGDIPAVYYWQCVHYMAVTGRAKWYLAVLVLGKGFHVFEIERNEAHINLLVAAERDFWNDHVLAKVPPYPTGSRDENGLMLMLPSDNGEDDIVDLQGMEDAIDTLQGLKEQKKELEQQINEIQQKAALELSGACQGRTNKWAISYKPQYESKIDAARLRKELPAVADKYSKQTTKTIMRIREVSEE